MSIQDSMEQLGNALQKMRDNMPAHVRAQWDAEDKRDKDLAETLRTDCIEALENIASAMRHPNIAVTDLESAIVRLVNALRCARELDA